MIMTSHSGDKNRKWSKTYNKSTHGILIELWTLSKFVYRIMTKEYEALLQTPQCSLTI